MDPKDKKILELLFQLSKCDKMLNSYEIAERIPLGNKKVTDRTIRRWFKELHEKHDFHYYPSPKRETYGLSYFYVIAKDLNEEVLRVIPYITFASRATEVGTFSNVTIAFYWIPSNNKGDFIKFWRKVKEKGLASSVQVRETKSPIAFYSPLHQVIDDTSNRDHNEEDFQFFMSKVAKSLHSKPEIHTVVKKHPLIVPILLEYYRDLSSSHKTWSQLKKKYGESIWNFISDHKIKFKKKEGLGRMYVKKLLDELHNNFDTFFQQIRVLYNPLVEDKIIFYLTIDSPSLSDLEKALREIYKNSIFTTVCPNLKKPSILFVVTDHKGWMNITNNILPKLPGKKKIYMYNWDDSQKFQNREYEKLEYTKLFDPETISWKFETEKYIKALDRIAK